MKLIFGAFPDRQVQQIMQAWEDARSRGTTTLVVPYWGETPVQMIDTNNCAKPRRISIHAHRGKPWAKARL